MLREDNVKVIRLRSTVMIENDADIPIIIDISDTRGDKELCIGSKETKSLPIDLVYGGN